MYYVIASTVSSGLITFVKIRARKGVNNQSSFNIFPLFFNILSGSELNKFTIFSPPFKNVSYKLLSNTLLKLKRDKVISGFRPWICLGGQSILDKEKFPLLK